MIRLLRFLDWFFLILYVSFLVHYLAGNYTGPKWLVIAACVMVLLIGHSLFRRNA